MGELIGIYIWTLLCAISFGPLLALIGMHVAGRDRAVQTFCTSQAAVLGVLIGIVGNHFVGATDLLNTILPFAFGVLAMLVSQLWIVKGEPIFKVSKSTFYIAIYVLLLSASAILTSLVPVLENHLSQRFFGDLATVLNFEAQIGLGFSVLALGTLALKWQKITKESFESTVLGLTLPKWNLLFVLEIFAISFAVMIFGLLFTLGCLFLGTTMAKYIGTKDLKAHTFFTFGLTMFGILFGLLLSLSQPKLPTVPTILCTIVVLGLCTSFFAQRNQSVVSSLSLE